MSRLAKKPIVFGKTTVTVDADAVSVKGAKGTLTKKVHSSISIAVSPEGIMVTPKDNSRIAKALVGTYAAHLKNMIAGVETPYVKKLILDGVGYRMELKGKDIVLTVGFSHPVTRTIPEGITAVIEKNVLTLSSIDKETLGQFAAEIRHVKPPEPYLGKGIHYEGEVIRRKQGKKAV